MSISKKLMTTGATGDTYVDDVFSTYLYEGTATGRDIVNGIDLDGEGGLVWIKSRTHGGNHNLIDTERGPSYALESDGSSAQLTDANQFGFLSNGFRINSIQSWDINQGNQDYASWTFRKAPSFFDVVTYTGTGVNREIPHDLGVEPGMVIVKGTDASVPWAVYHTGMAEPTKEYLHLDTNDKAMFNTGVWNDTAPTSSAFTVGSSSYVNTADQEYVAYVFAHDDSDEGLIQCGGYTGNGSADGPEIDLGWEPQWLLVKSTTASEQSWGMYDVMRGMPTGGDTAYLSPDRSNEEYANQGWIDVTPRGFKLVNQDNFVNGSGDQYIYMAIRRPNKPASEFEADELFAVDTGDSTLSEAEFQSGFPVGMAIVTQPGSNQDNKVSARLMQGQILDTDKSTAQQTNAA